MIHRDALAYSAHPHLVATAERLAARLHASRRRAGVLHPPQDPLFRTCWCGPSDEGRTWSAPSVVPDFGWQGVECAGLTALSSGAVLLNQWRFNWHTLAWARGASRVPDYTAARSVDGRTRHGGRARRMDARPGHDIRAIPLGARRRRDMGASIRRWRQDLPALDAHRLQPFSGGYGMRGGVEIGGEIVLPLSDVPNYRAVFTVRSRDGGESWSKPDLVAAGDGHAFEEPAPLLLRSGRILMLLRDNVTAHPSHGPLRRRRGDLERAAADRHRRLSRRSRRAGRRPHRRRLPAAGGRLSASRSTSPRMAARAGAPSVRSSSAPGCPTETSAIPRSHCVRTVACSLPTMRRTGRRDRHPCKRARRRLGRRPRIGGID